MLLGIHHTSFTVADLERTVSFYRDVVGMRLLGRKHRRSDDLGTALLGPLAGDATVPGEVLIADMAAGDARLEFIQYVEPPGVTYHGDPSRAGSAHIAILTKDIEVEYDRLVKAGVQFHTPVRTVRDPGRPTWKWCYFRDPDGICVEIVESLDEPSGSA